METKIENTLPTNLNPIPFLTLRDVVRFTESARYQIFSFVEVLQKQSDEKIVDFADDFKPILEKLFEIEEISFDLYVKSKGYEKK